MTKQAWLTCSVSPGQFPGEYAVSGVEYNQHPYSLFAPRDAVRAPQGDEGPGQVLVDVIDERGDLVLVRLPAQTFDNGQHITVQASQLGSSPPAQRVGA